MCRMERHMSSGYGEVEITDATYKGKEQVNIKDDKHQLETIPFVREGHFRLMDLPAELRVYIYYFLLPNNVVLSHRRTSDSRPGYKGEPWWRIEATNKQNGEPERILIGRQPRGPWDWERPIKARPWPVPLPHRRVAEKRLMPQTQLFVLNKEVSCEAQAVLYGSNKYVFTINGTAHFPVSLVSPLIFGPFGDDDGIRLPLLRNLRSIHIEIVLDTKSHWAVKRQRGRLEYFVEILKQHSDDANLKSLLEELVVEVQVPVVPEIPHPVLPGLTPYQSNPKPEDAEKYMFGLESLASLRSIKKVTITGVPDWYARCLQLCIQGKGGEVIETHWPLVEIKWTLKITRSRWMTKTTKAWVTTRKWYQPTLNWKEFAERNNINIPADIDKFWVAVN